MRKNKLVFIAMSAMLVFMMLLSACGGGGSGGDALSGTWEGKDDNGTKVTLKFDGKGGLKFSDEFFSAEESGTYSIQEDQVEIKAESWDAVRSYTFVIKDKSLTLTRPEDAYYVNFDLTKK
jgi:hypothetical protein